MEKQFATLTEELNAWYAAEGLEPSCALEALMFGLFDTPAQALWLADFNARWDAATETERWGDSA